LGQQLEKLNGAGQTIEGVTRDTVVVVINEERESGHDRKAMPEERLK